MCGCFRFFTVFLICGLFSVSACDTRNDSQRFVDSVIDNALGEPASGAEIRQFVSGKTFAAADIALMGGEWYHAPDGSFGSIGPRDEVTIAIGSWSVRDDVLCTRLTSYEKLNGNWQKYNPETFCVRLYISEDGTARARDRNNDYIVDLSKPVNGFPRQAEFDARRAEIGI